MASLSDRRFQTNGHVPHRPRANPLHLTARERLLLRRLRRGKHGRPDVAQASEGPFPDGLTPIVPTPPEGRGAAPPFVRIGHMRVPGDADPAALAEWIPRHMMAMHIDFLAQSLQEAMWQDEAVCKVMDEGGRHLAKVGDPVPFEREHEMFLAKNALVGETEDMVNAAEDRLREAVFKALKLERAISADYDTSRLDDPIGVRVRDWLVWLSPEKDGDGAESIRVTLVRLDQVEELPWDFKQD